MRDLEVGDRREAAWAPVDHVLAAIDEALLIQADENFAHGAGEVLIEGEVLPAPIAARADLDHLAPDGVAGFRLPLPDALLELLASHLAAVEPLFGQLALDHHLGRDPGVI